MQKLVALTIVVVIVAFRDRLGGRSTKGKEQGQVTRPWTEAETRQLRGSAKRVSAEDIAKALGRHVGPVKRKARELGLILFKKVKAKPKG